MTTKAITLADAEQQLSKATDTLAALKAKILDKGPGSVTAEELGTAVLAVEHAKLGVQHATEAAVAQAEADRQQQLQELKAQILDQAGDADTALDAMTAIENAAAVLIEACAGRQQLIAKATASMRKAGVPRHIDGQADQHAGLAWSDAGMGRSDTVYVDGRRLAHLSPGLVIAAALERAARTAGCGSRHLQPVIEMRSTDRAALDDPDTWLRARY
jgi:hypothetical protein